MASLFMAAQAGFQLAATTSTDSKDYDCKGSSCFIRNFEMHDFATAHPPPFATLPAALCTILVATGLSHIPQSEQHAQDVLETLLVRKESWTARRRAPTIGPCSWKSRTSASRMRRSYLTSKHWLLCCWSEDFQAQGLEQRCKTWP